MRFAGTSYVAARPKDVFEVVGDPTRLREWLTNVDHVERVSEPAVDRGPGTFRVTATVDDAPVVVEGHTAVWGPQHRVGFEFTSEVGGWEVEYVIRPAGATTRLDVVVVAKRSGALKRLRQWFRAGQTRQEFVESLARLRDVIEMGSARGSEGSSVN